MVGALDRMPCLTTLLTTKSRAAVAADIEEGAQHTIPAPQEQDILVGKGECAIRSRPRQFLSTTDTDPHRGENVLLLARVDRGIIIEAAGEGAKKGRVGS